MEKVPDAMKKIGYFESSKPWRFADTQLTLHRFMKVEGEDHLVVDILTGLQNRHRQIVDRATDQSWKDGVVKVARKNDLIWMKKQRGSDQDKVDIGKLKNDNNREDGPRTK